MKKWLKEMRVTHYLKNALIFLPAFFGGDIWEVAIWKNLIIGFCSFCLGASAVYLMNDIKDMEKDRMHPTKCKRPIASGEISVRQATAGAIILLLVSSIVMWFGTDTANHGSALGVFLLYIVVNVLYSVFGMKKVPLLDVVLLVIGFYLRVLMGSVLTQVVISPWLYLVIITGAFFLGFGKRRNELLMLGIKGRDSLEGYSENFLDKIMYSCMTMTIIFFSLWCVQQENAERYLILIPLLMIICFRYTMGMEQKDSDGDPMNMILGDKILLGLGVLLGILMLGIIYF